jgi:hypothetical protein
LRSTENRNLQERETGPSKYRREGRKQIFGISEKPGTGGEIGCDDRMQQSMSYIFAVLYTFPSTVALCAYVSDSPYRGEISYFTRIVGHVNELNIACVIIYRKRDVRRRFVEIVAQLRGARVKVSDVVQRR